MTITVQDILNILETSAPVSLAEKWDNVGLLVGTPAAHVTSVVVGLDPIPSLLREATALGANLLVTHHPIIFRPLSALATDQPDGHFIAQALRQQINIIGWHTNFDSAARGVSEILAQGLGLGNCMPLQAGSQENKLGPGRFGTYAQPLEPAEFIGRLRKLCTPPWLLAAGPVPRTIERVAVCGGSGSDLAARAHALGAQVYVTAEVKHSVARWAEQVGLWIIDAGHFATENPAMSLLADELQNGLARLGTPLPVRCAEQNHPLELL